MDGIEGQGLNTLVDSINNAFSPGNIEESVRRLEGLSPRADFLTISRTLGILGRMDDARFRRYRRNLTIPPLIQQVLTAVHRTSLFRQPPTPIRIEINDVTPPSIEVTVTDQLISIRLNRADPRRNRLSV